MDVFDLPPFQQASVLERVQDRVPTETVLDETFGSFIDETTVATTYVEIERSGAGDVEVLPYTPRGAPLPRRALDKRQKTLLEIPFFGEAFSVSYLETLNVQGLNGQPGQLIAAQDLIDRHTERANERLDRVEQQQFIHGVFRGFITDKDETIAMDVYDELGFTGQKEALIDVTDAKANWIKALQGMKDDIEVDAGGESVSYYALICGSGIADWMNSNPLYMEQYTDKLAQRLSQEDNRAGTAINTDINVRSLRKPGWLEPYEAYLMALYPKCIRKVYGPNHVQQYLGQTLPRYVTREDLEHGKGVDYEITEACIQIAKRPNTVRRIGFKGFGGAANPGNA